MLLTIRDYAPEDEDGWLRCRILSFLATAYFDDVAKTRPVIESPGFALVAEQAGAVVGVLDVSVAGDLATVDTIAVHPDAQRVGIGTALLAQALSRAVESGAVLIDAWTRDDRQALSWYRSHGFEESEHYLHVYANLYADPSEPRKAIAATHFGLGPVAVFSHADLAREAELRRAFSRVHVCRRFLRRLQH